MFQENDVLYGLNKALPSKVVSLKFKDPNFTMIIFLPNENIGLDSLRFNLKDNDLNKIHNSFNSEDLLQGFPTFKLAFKTPLIPTFIFNERQQTYQKCPMNPWLCPIFCMKLG